MRKLDAASYQRGRQLYDAGANLAEVFADVERIELASREAHAAPDLSNDDHELIAARVPSLTLGFADGALADLRLIVGRRGQRA